MRMPSVGQDGRVNLPGGRVLGYREYGEPSGRPLLHCHGVLSSRWEGYWVHEAARQRGVRLITIDRPGIGISDPAPRYRLEHWASDVRFLADSLGLARCSVMGVSGGTPYALACAQAWPERIDRLIIVSGLAPVQDPEVYQLLKLPQKLLYSATARHPVVAWPFLEFNRWMSRALPLSLAFLTLEFVGRMIGGLARADREIFRDPVIRQRVMDFPVEARRSVFAQGTGGAMWDGHVMVRPWSLDLPSIRVPTELWYGGDDQIIPVPMGRWFAKTLPGARAHFLDGEGHLSVIMGKGACILETIGTNIPAVPA